MSEPFAWLGGFPAPESEGWGAVDASGLSREEAEAQQTALLEEFDEARLVFDVFSEGRGPELFELLRQKLFETPTVQVVGQIGHSDLQMAITPEQWLWIRAGQNSVLHWLRGLMEQARKGPPRVAAGHGESNG